MDSDSRAVSELTRQQAVLPREDGDEALIYSLSWTAYPRLLFKLVLRVIILMGIYALAISLFKVKHTNLLANVGVFVTPVVALLWTVYDFAYLRTMKLYVDRQGVWLAQGLLPWSKGYNGVRWDEIGDASYRQSFLSWACKSYSVTVAHRFTTNAELFLDHVKRGDIAVQSINRLLIARARGY